MGRRWEALRVALLGANLWAVLLFMPAWLEEGLGPARWVLGTLPLLPLMAGAIWLSTRRSRVHARWLLIVAYPTGLALGLLLERGLPSPIWIATSLISFIAYGAFTSSALTRPTELRAAADPSQPPSRAPLPIDRRRRWLRRGTLGIAAIGAFAILAIAPFDTRPQELERLWGSAAREGLLLATLGAGALGAVIFASFIGPALRLERTRRPRRFAPSRFILLLITGAAGLYLHQLLGR
ncbi:MAG: hypothetical protein OEY14_18355 [Myxococcales bacterium]|nr:hypothetical protein [Myxococcales bacterium]